MNWKDFFDLMAILLILAVIVEGMRASKKQVFDNPMVSPKDFFFRFDSNEYEKERQCFMQVFKKTWNKEKEWLAGATTSQQREDFEKRIVNDFLGMLDRQEAEHFYGEVNLSSMDRKLFDSVLEKSRKSFLDILAFRELEQQAEKVKGETEKIQANWTLEFKKQKLEELGVLEDVDLLN